MSPEHTFAGPTGAAYALARWAEVVDEAAPWWTRPDGVGLRLRLVELLDVAGARQEGRLRDEPIRVLLDEARRVLGQSGTGFLAERFAAASEMVRAAISREPEQFAPDGRAYCMVQAASQLLNDSAYTSALIDELCVRAAAADDIVSLLAIDEMVELIDAELAYDGHSRHWRKRLVAEVQDRLVPGEVELPKAIRAALEALEHGAKRDFDIFVPLDAERHEPVQTQVPLPWVDEGDALLQIEQRGADLPEDAPDLRWGALRYEAKSIPDPYAALERVEQQLETDMSLWRLQGGAAAVGSHALLLEGSKATVIERPAPLLLEPSNLRRFARELGEQSRRGSSGRLADAFVQLAQARIGSSGAMLADLWVVAETLFGGVASEPRYEAGTVLADVAEALAVRHHLEWVAQRLQAAGLGAIGSADPAGWAIERLSGTALRALLEADDALGWVRAKSAMRWVTGALDEHLRGVGERTSSVCSRAYLVRNFFVHQSQPQRARALDVTLPVFADLVRVCLSAVSAQDSVITDAELACLRLRQLAKDLLVEGRIDEADRSGALLEALPPGPV